MELLVQDYSLVVVPRPPTGGEPHEIDIGELGQIMHDPILVGDGERIVSARDQLSLVFRPPSLMVVDHNGAAPARAEMVATAVAVTELLRNLGFTHQAYGWNVQGSVNGARPRETMAQLADARRISEALGGRDTNWTIPQVTISAELPIADRVNIVLQIGTAPDGSETLAFNTNAHHEGAPDVARLQEEGNRMWRAMSEMIGRLVG